MIKLGLTGNIATGKSLLESFLKEMEIPVTDADQIVHEIYEKDSRTITKICDLFEPAQIKTSSGSIDRKKLGEIVFNDNSKLKSLEKIIHPIVEDKIAEFFVVNSKKQVVVVSMPLLYEAKMEKLFDYIICVIADPQKQLQRLMERNEFSKEEAMKRIKSQIPQEEKKNRADFVIDNSFSIENTRKQLEKIINSLIR